MSAIVDSRVISAVSDKEKQLTHESETVKNGPTATAESHQDELLTSQLISDIAKAESKLHPGQSVRAGGPAATAQSMAARSVIDDQFISAISTKEQEMTNNPDTVDGGPTAAAEAHKGQRLSGPIVSDIAKGEAKLHPGEPTHAGGPAATAQSVLANGTTTSNRRPSKSNGSVNTTTNAASTAGTLSAAIDAASIAKVTEAEKKITNSSDPAEDGPTAVAQKHAGDSITSETLHDVTMGEKKVTGGERVKGGPTSVLQGELAQSRN